MEQIFSYIDLIGGLSYLGLFLIIAGAGYVIPVPEEIVILVIGYFISMGVFNPIYTAIVAFVALVFADNVLFRFSSMDHKYIRKSREYVLRLPFIKKHISGMEKHIYATIFLSRFLPYLRFASPIIAGTLRVKWSTFLFYDVLAMVLYVPIFLGIGYLFHSNLDLIIYKVEAFRHYVFVGVALIAGFFIMIGINKKLDEYAEESNNNIK